VYLSEFLIDSFDVILYFDLFYIRFNAEKRQEHRVQSISRYVIIFHVGGEEEGEVYLSEFLVDFFDIILYSDLFYIRFDAPNRREHRVQPIFRYLIIFYVGGEEEGEVYLSEFLVDFFDVILYSDLFHIRFNALKRREHRVEPIFRYLNIFLWEGKSRRSQYYINSCSCILRYIL
jgi:hypothetical protein